MSTNDPLISAGDFGQLRAFVAVAEVLNFTRAAEKLGVSSSALSQMVRGLEERVGVRLLHRNTRNVSLTEAGDRLFQRVRPAVQELAAAIGQTSELRERPAGLLRIHCFRTAADLFLRPLLRSFHDTYPEIVLGAPQHPRDLVSHQCIGWRWPGHEVPYKWEFLEDGKWFEVTVEGPIITNSKEFAVQAAIEGLGIAFPTQQLSAPHVAAGRLVCLLESWSAPFPGFFLCYPSPRQMAPALRAFIDAIRAKVRELDGTE